MTRQQYFAGFFGINGTGKTWLALSFAEQFVQKTGKRWLNIISDTSEAKFHKYPILKIRTDYKKLAKKGTLTVQDIDIQDFKTFASFKGIANVICEDTALFAFLQVVYTEPIDPEDPNDFLGLNGGILLDDCKNYLEARPEFLLNLLRRRRQLNADIIATFHGFTSEMPRSFVNWLTNVAIWRVNTPIVSFLDLLDHEKRNVVQQAFIEMKRVTSIPHPSKKDPTTGMPIPKFPHYYTEAQLQPVFLH